MKQLVRWILLGATIPGASGVIAQTSTPPPSRTIVCDETSGCTHRYVNGELFKTITGPDGMVVTAGLVESSNGKFFRLNVSVVNNTSATFDLMPDNFVIETVGRKPKTLNPVPPGQIAKSVERGAWWADYFNRVGARMATQQSITRTTSSSSASGTIDAHSSDGTYANGSYHGTTSGESTTTTTSPDYAAQARADEKIRQRDAAIAAMNERMMQTALTANTLSPGQSVAGYVYFNSATADALHPKLAIAGRVYEFEF